MPDPTPIKDLAACQRRSWTIRSANKSLELGPMPILMGIVNVTPESFSDGGQFLDPGRAVAHALELAAQGAAIIDIGGESTRPGSPELPADEEAARVLPVIAELRRQSSVWISIDTRKPSVARAALDAGADLVNDISALADPDMAPLLARAGCPVVLMHMQGAPATMQLNPVYDEVVADVCRELRCSLARAVAAGIDLEQTIIDPGFGFGKTFDHNLALLARLGELRSLGRPILVGTSRKAFLGRLLDNAPPAARLPGTIATTLWTRAAGAAIFRVHDVAEVAAALTVVAAIERGDCRT
jgi:dihydropteroate synthase